MNSFLYYTHYYVALFTVISVKPIDLRDNDVGIFITIVKSYLNNACNLFTFSLLIFNLVL